MYRSYIYLYNVRFAEFAPSPDLDRHFFDALFMKGRYHSAGPEPAVRHPSCRRVITPRDTVATSTERKGGYSPRTISYYLSVQLIIY